MSRLSQPPITANSKQTQTQVQGKETNKKFWNFIKNAATENEEESVELRIEGDIVDLEDAWIYEWFGIPVASPNAFRNELARYAGKDITVWIDSYGGSVFAGAGIYNALMEHDGKVTAKINKAMSAASVIAMAADEIDMSPVGIMMIHNPLTGAQGDARVMRKAADVLDTVKDTIVNAYQLKTGKSTDQISSMMDDETWMSANVAVKEGFADKVLYSEKETMSVENNFTFSHLAIQNSMDDSFKKFFEIAQKNDALQAQPVANINHSKEVKSNMEIKNSTEFKAQLPAIHDEVYNSGITAGKNDGIKAERERLKAFDVLNGKVDPEFLAKEKYEEGATAESVLFKAMQEGKMINAAYVANVVKDAETANQVEGAASDNSTPDEVTGVLNFVKNVAEKTVGKLKGGNK